MTFKTFFYSYPLWANTSISGLKLSPIVPEENDRWLHYCKSKTCCHYYVIQSSIVGFNTQASVVLVIAKDFHFRPKSQFFRFRWTDYLPVHESNGCVVLMFVMNMGLGTYNSVQCAWKIVGTIRLVRLVRLRFQCYVAYICSESLGVLV